MLSLARQSALCFSTSFTGIHPSLFDILEPKSKRPRVQRMRFRDATKSPWSLDLREWDLSNDFTYDAKLFRKRNRIPYSMFRDFVKFANTHFPQKPDALGFSKPTELKVLGFFRFMAVNIGLDYIKELSYLGIETHRSFNAKFSRKIKQLMGPEWVRWPRTAQEIALATKPFSAVGLQGFVTQMDCTHLLWHKCPIKNKVKSKHHDKKVTTLAFLVACGYDTWIHHCSSGYPGYK